ncbi:MAG: hypothetical protein KGJ35_02825, partial [Patescibacteria group bacterium]|nr:hypothetical protein [Patescibacteria group bacterium]
MPLQYHIFPHNSVVTISRRSESIILFLGDIIVLTFALFLAFTIRYGSMPSPSVFGSYLLPFSFLFIVSVFIYFVAGLYDKHTLVIVRRIPQILLGVQGVVAIIAVAFFYLVPFFVIAPKTFLFIYLVLALAFGSGWRMSYVALFKVSKRQPSLLIATGKESEDLYEEINGNARYGLTFVNHLQTATNDVVNLIKEKNVTFIAGDFTDVEMQTVLPSLYQFFFKGVEFADIRDLYEDIFDRVPLSLIDDAW